MKQKILLIILLLNLIGCSEVSEDSAEDITFTEVIGVIFDGVSSKLQSSRNYTPIEGRVSATFEGTPDTGNFKFSYSNFNEPALCGFGQDCACAGLVVGTYNKGESENKDSEESNEKPYDPSQSEEEEDITQENEEEDSFVFLELTIDQDKTSMSQFCVTQINRTIKVSVFNDRRIIITDNGRDLLLKPRLK